jgi:hypothetical protein
MAKADARKQSEWQRRLDRFESSGLTIAQFCRNEGIPVHTFYYWGKRLGRRSRRSRRSDSRTPSEKARDSVSSDKDAAALGGRHSRPLVHFTWGSKLRITVPAECVDAIRCVLQHAHQEEGGLRDAARPFQEVILAE